MNLQEKFPCITELPTYGVTTSEGDRTFNALERLLLEMDDALASCIDTRDGLMCSVTAIRGQMNTMNDPRLSAEVFQPILFSDARRVSKSVMMNTRSAIEKLQQSKPR